jgi:hypothetical protein
MSGGPDGVRGRDLGEYRVRNGMRSALVPVLIRKCSSSDPRRSRTGRSGDGHPAHAVPASGGRRAGWPRSGSIAGDRSAPAVGYRPALVTGRQGRSARPAARHTPGTGQASMIRQHIIWRNTHVYDERLRRIIERANVA